MGHLQELFETQLQQCLSQDPTLYGVVQLAMERRGHSISRETAKALIAKSRRGESLEIPANANVTTSESITLTEHDLNAAFEDHQEAVSNAIHETISEVLAKIAPSMLATLKEGREEHLTERRRAYAEFTQLNSEFWKESLDRLEMLIMVIDEAARLMAEEWHEQQSEATPTFVSLYGLCTRALRTADEILVLLRSGFADGANARWRSLHELAVTAMFIAEQGDATAQRYLDYSIVERFRAGEQYHHHAKTLGFKELTAQEQNELRGEYNAIVQKYGKAFKSAYGWAASAINAKSVCFADIESSLDLGHWRPFYGLACQSVHASANGMLFSLSQAPHDGPGLSARPSVAGLCDPGQCTVESLLMCATALLSYEPDVDRLAACEVIRLLAQEAVDCFYDGHQRLEEGADLDIGEIEEDPRDEGTEADSE